MDFRWSREQRKIMFFCFFLFAIIICYLFIYFYPEDGVLKLKSSATEKEKRGETKGARRALRHIIIIIHSFITPKSP